MTTTYLLSLDGASVHCEVAKVGEELLGTILALDELEEIWSVVDELSNLRLFSIPLTFCCQKNTHCSPSLSGDEDIMRKKSE